VEGTVVIGRLTTGLEGGSELRIASYKDLDVYKRSMDLGMEIFRLTKKFPDEERYSLTDQIRKASRSVPANISEAWRKRRYRAAFVSRLNDAETEACETQVWVEFARRCEYVTDPTAAHLDEECDHILAQLVKMIDEPEKWLIRAR
jgi:four helix bundle protein